MSQFIEKSLGFNLTFSDAESKVAYTLRRVSEARYSKLLQDIRDLVNTYKQNHEEANVAIFLIPYTVCVNQVFRGFGDGHLTHQVITQDDGVLGLKITGQYKIGTDDTLCVHSITVPIPDILQDDA